MDSTIVISEDSNNTMNKPEPLKKTGLGERLKSAREAMRLTEKEAAARLHLNVNIISLMENENFTNGPPATFIRGYLRSYARLLNLSENEITLTLKDLESSIPSSNTATPVVHMQPKKYNERYFHWLTYVIVLVLVVLVSVWWSSHSRYVIADVPPVQPATTASQSTATPQNLTESGQSTTDAKTPIETPAALNPTVIAPAAPALAPPTTMTQPSISSKAPEPTISVTPATQSSTVSAAAKPTKKTTISNMDMALPEPGVDNDEDE